MVTTPPERCPRCGSDVVTTRGPGRTTVFSGATIAVPEHMELRSCHDCGRSEPTRAQARELLEILERDLIGYDGRGRPVLRGT